jgi:tryptophanyl-tRNA synthetase
VAHRASPTDPPATSDTFAESWRRTQATRSDLDAHPERYRVMTGDRPTGSLHLGHYFGTLASRVVLQDQGVDTWVLVADYQVITDRATTENIQENVRGLVLDYVAAGIDPERSVIFAHSAVPALNQLMLPFLSLVTEAELHRNPTVKAELAASGRALSGLLLTYPVHQAADILFCKGNLVPVGKDQLPHIEQTRVIARRFNDRYTKKNPVFPQPQALLADTPEIPGLDGRKMSKSYGNAISLGMTADETAKLIRKAPTDSDRHITFDPENRPGVSALLTSAALCTGGDPVRIAEEIGDGGGGALKAYVTEAVNEHFAGHRARRAELAADLGYVHTVLERGNARANEVAETTLGEVRAAMGTVY